jgi:hypothetical protein
MFQKERNTTSTLPGFGLKLEVGKKREKKFLKQRAFDDDIS